MIRCVFQHDHIILNKNIHLTLTLKRLCINQLKGDNEVLINYRQRTFLTTAVCLRLLIYFSSPPFN